MKRSLIPLAAAAVVLAGCSPKAAIVPATLAAPATILWGATNPVFPITKIVGNYDNYNEVFVGDASRRLLDGLELVQFTLRNSGVTCNGVMEHQDDWPNELPDPMGVCLSRIAKGSVQCTDGRELALTWRATECRTAFGTGFDRNGGTLTFLLGFDDAQAAVQADKLAVQLSPFAPLPPVGPR
ncbi:MAG: hypothetical protein MUE39_08945 [Gammaproteobacteria bacterium]|jgi:hypothetical protein|nr:hypothetical protein [Gammaproteobacteria bacterium]